MKSILLISLGLIGIASATPTKSIEKRASFCGQWDSQVTGSYTVYNDLWGEAEASSGSQCTTINSLSGNTLAWETEWTWAGGSSSVKSFANAAYSFTAKQLSSIGSIPTTWKWRYVPFFFFFSSSDICRSICYISQFVARLTLIAASYTGSNIDGDVAYDLFTSSSASGSNEYEIMIWLAALGGAGPISSTGSAVATVTIGGVSWSLYSGPNGSTTVYSFVASSEQTNFSGDLIDFFQYLEENEGFNSSQYLLSIQAGTEPFTGSGAQLTTTAYSVSVS